jgi:hypothetical protein
MTNEITKGDIRKIRARIIQRSKELESLKPVGKCEIAETDAYIRGLEFALRSIDIQIEI